MSSTVRKALHSLAVLVLVAVLTNVDKLPQDAPYRSLLVSGAAVAMMLLRKIDPSIAPAEPDATPQPVIPPAPSVGMTEMVQGVDSQGNIRNFSLADIPAAPAPKVIIRDRPRDAEDSADARGEASRLTVKFGVTSEAIARACEIRGLAPPTTPADREAALRFAANDALSSAGVFPIEPPSSDPVDAVAP